MRGVRRASLVDWHGNAFLRFKLPLNSLVHSFGQASGDPDFLALSAGLDRYIFKKIKMSFHQAVKRSFLAV